MKVLSQKQNIVSELLPSNASSFRFSFSNFSFLPLFPFLLSFLLSSLHTFLLSSPIPFFIPIPFSIPFPFFIPFPFPLPLSSPPFLFLFSLPFSFPFPFPFLSFSFPFPFPSPFPFTFFPSPPLSFPPPT